jgi:phosphoglycolate phosphatase
MISAIIFDFDGTLVNSETAIYECFQHITHEIAPDRIGYAKEVLIGPPLEETAKEILGENNLHLAEIFVKKFIQLHDNEIILHSKPYPHALDTLKKLHDKNISMAIATNKRKVPTIKLLNHFHWNSYFKLIECSDSKSIKRNKDLMIKEIMQKYPDFKNGLFIGDTVNDGKAAGQNNLKFIKANYGYGHNQDWSDVNIFKEIDVLNEILKII